MLDNIAAYRGRSITRWLKAIRRLIDKIAKATVEAELSDAQVIFMHIPKSAGEVHADAL